MSTLENAPLYDCVIVGGGPAGLTAATYLGRFHRRTLVIDAGKSRLSAISCSYNIAGFPEGISGSAIWGRLKRQARRYGTEIWKATVTSVEPAAGGKFLIGAGDHTIAARAVLLATGVVLTEPKIPGLSAPLATGYFRPCPICDGFEASGKQVAVIGRSERAVHEAQFLLAYTPHLRIITLGQELDQPDARAVLMQRGIDVFTSSVESCRLIEGRHRFTFADGTQADFDMVYGALGLQPMPAFIRALNLRGESAECIAVQSHQQTSLPGVFAAGDIVEGLDQINVASGHGAIAATAIHNYLREQPS